MVRFGARVAVGLAALIAVLMLGTPLLLRGPLLVRIAHRLAPPTCGRVDARGASLGVLSVVELLTGRPFSIEVDGLAVDDPAGRRVLYAERTSAHVQVQRDPLRLTVHDLRVGPGTWKMLADRRTGVSLVAAFLPAGHCTPAPPTPGAAAPRAPSPKPGGPVPELRLLRADLVNLDITFDFDDWGLAFAHASAVGSMSVTPGPDGKPRLLFDVHDVRSGPGSSLRVGRPRQAWNAELPFDAVEIARAAAAADSPSDLVLEVARATTGRSELGGRAVFLGILGRAGPGGPGLDVTAHWNRVADAIARLRAAWRPVIAQAIAHEDTDLGVTLHGPFSGMSARVNARGPRAQLDLSLAPDLSAEAQLVIDHVNTSPHLPPSMRPLLGGIATGRVRLTARLASRLGRVRGSLAEMDLRLDRERGGAVPSRWRLAKGRVGPPARDLPRNTPSLEMAVASAELERGVLAVRGLAGVLRPTGGAVEGDTTLALTDPAGSRLLENPRIDTRLRFQNLGAQVLRGVGMSGAVSGAVTVDGPSDDLRMSVRLAGTRQITLAGVAITLPPAVKARLQDGELLTIPPTRFAGPGGAALEGQGKVVVDRSIDATVSGQGWPLASTPLPRLTAEADRGWKGTFDGVLHLTGRPLNPGVAGDVTLHRVAVAGLALGDGTFSFSHQREDARFEGQLGPHFQASGRGRLDGRRQLEVKARISGLVLDPWLRRLSPAASATVTGDVDLSLKSGADPTGTATFSDVRARWGRLVALANQGPVVVRGTPKEAVLEPTTFAGAGTSVQLEGRVADQALDAGAHVTVALATLVGMIPRGPVRLGQAAGDLAVTVNARGPLAAPAVAVTTSAGQPMSVMVSAAGRPAIRVAINAATGSLDLVPAEPPRLRVEALTVSTPGASLDVAGTVALDEHDPWASAGTASATARLDGRLLTEYARGALERADGQVTVRARLDGPLRAPSWRATLEAARVMLLPRKAETLVSIPSLRATVEGLRLSVQPFELGIYSLGSGASSPSRLFIGAAGQPSVVDVTSLEPLELGRVDVGVKGTGVDLPGTFSGAAIKDATLDLTMAGPGAQGWYTLGGTVTLPRAGVRPTTSKPAALPASGKNPLGRLLRRIWLDLHLRVGDVAVEAPGPNLRVEADCRVEGPLVKPRTSGRVSGLDLYSKAALFLADTFAGTHARNCSK